MLNWIFEGIVNWVATVLSNLLDSFNQPILELMGMNLTTIKSYIPFVETAYKVFQYTAWALLFLIVVFQLVRTMGGPITHGENPLILIARSALFAFLIGACRELFDVLMVIGSVPYDTMMSIQPGEESEIFADFQAYASSWATNVAIGSTIIGTIMCIILVIAIGWNYFKLLLESVERYVMLGVLAYTAPLAFATGGSESTSNVFASWCRMVASEILLLILNVFFLRGFTSAVGVGVMGGAVEGSTNGSFLLWCFVLLAWLKIGQRVDSYLASLGLSTAQTGSAMGMEMLMAARVLGGFGGSIAGRAGSVLGGPTGGGAGKPSFSNFLGRRSAANYAADAASINGAKTAPFTAASWVAHRVAGANNATSATGLSTASISRVANSPTDPRVLGTAAADRGLANGNYFSSLAGRKLSNTRIGSGHISTTATNADGSEAQLDFYNASMYSKPSGAFSTVQAEDGSTWYQTASGDGRGAFFDTPQFTGAETADEFAAAFPSVGAGTTLRTVDDGIIAAAAGDIGGDSGSMEGESMWYSSASYLEPEQPHTTIQDSNGVTWYQTMPTAAVPETCSAAASLFPGLVSDDAITYHSSQMAGTFDVVGSNGSGTKYFDAACYARPGVAHQAVTDINGHQWYAVPGTQRGDNMVYGQARYLQPPDRRGISPEPPPKRVAPLNGQTKSGRS